MLLAKTCGAVASTTPVFASQNVIVPLVHPRANVFRSGESAAKESFSFTGPRETISLGVCVDILNVFKKQCVLLVIREPLSSENATASSASANTDTCFNVATSHAATLLPSMLAAMNWPSGEKIGREITFETIATVRWGWTLQSL